MKLVPPSIEYADEIAAYRREFLEYGGSMDGCGSLRHFENVCDWLDDTERFSKRETVPENRVQATQFIYVRESDGKMVGAIQVRHYFNDYLRDYGGHIGYSVRPSERRKGYATAMLRDVLPYCSEIGLDKVMISCDDDNEGSRRTILKNGGIYSETVHEPNEDVMIEKYWIDL